MNQPFLRVVGGVLIFLAALWVGAGMIFWSRLPTIYQASAMFTMAENPNGVFDKDKFQKEIEKLQSPLVLGQVITNLNLGQRWRATTKTSEKLAEDSTFQMLKQRLNVRPTRGTRLIEVQVRSQDPGEAAQIANAIAEVYREMNMPEELKKKLAEGQKLTPAELGRSQVQIVDSAKPPLRLISPEPLVGFLNLVPGFCLGIGGLVMLAKSRKESAAQF